MSAYRHENVPYAEGEREACNVFFTWEMFRPLMRGATLYVVPDTTIYDPRLLAAYLREHAITRMLFTPSLLEALLNEPSIDVTRDLASFRHVILCGEVVTTDLRARAVKLLPGVREARNGGALVPATLAASKMRVFFCVRGHLASASHAHKRKNIRNINCAPVRTRRRAGVAVESVQHQRMPRRVLRRLA